ncbi:hypothetical protein E2320_004334 [Naja naja]|nr:hypothetical protein E2320_004334 [Naja naja]
MTSPSGVVVFLTTWIRTEALMIMLFLRSPTEHETQVAITDSDDRIPAEDQSFSSPVGLGGFHKDATQHDRVDDQAHNVLEDQNTDGYGTFLGHHPSTETNGHLDLNGEEESRDEGPVGKAEKMLQGLSMSPWEKATSHHIMAKNSQLQRKDMVKITRVWRHFRSTKVVKMSCRKRPCSRMFLWARLQAPFLAMKRALRWRSRMRGLPKFSAAMRARTYSSGIMLFLANIFLPPLPNN